MPSPNYLQTQVQAESSSILSHFWTTLRILPFLNWSFTLHSCVKFSIFALLDQEIWLPMLWRESSKSFCSQVYGSSPHQLSNSVLNQSASFPFWCNNRWVWTPFSFFIFHTNYSNKVSKKPQTNNLQWTCKG